METFALFSKDDYPKIKLKELIGLLFKPFCTSVKDVQAFLVLTSLSVCKFFKELFLDCPPFFVGSECKGIAFSVTHQTFSEKSFKKACFLLDS